MRRAALPLFGSLAACVATNPPARGETPGRHCHSSNTGHFVGQAATDALGSAILRETGASVLRWGAPGVMLTMDYRFDRVTVRFGPDRKVTAINCG